jgi:F-type H+-transporting ATPase subunit b
MQLVTPGIGLIFWMVLSFGIVFFLLKKFAWGPILGIITEREESIEKALKAAEIAKEDLKLYQNQNEKLLNEARAEREEMMKEARESKDRILAEAKQKAGEEASRIIESARIEIKAEKNAAINEIKTQVAVLSVEIAEKILKSELSSDEKQKALMANLLAEAKLN